MAYILIIDREAVFRQHLIHLIEQAGHRAIAVATIAEATRILQQITPDMLATDVVVADGSSAGLIRRVTRLGAQTLLMTRSPARMAEFDGAGQAYLQKPFLPQRFVQQVKEMLATKSASDIGPHLRRSI